MTDAGHRETEEVLKRLEKEISKEYAQAEKEIAEKLDDYMRRFKIKDELKRKAVENGQITQAEYEKWRVGQVAIGERWTEMRDTIAEDFANAAQIAKSITTGYMPDVYAINHNYGTYQVEQASLVDTSYTLYDRQTVQRLFDDKNTLYHKAGRKVTAAINMGKQIAWDKKQVQSVMLQGLLQGESIGKIATRLSKTVGESDRKAAIRNARTMTTGVQNAGRVDSYKRAQDMGIDLMQEWLATLDGRTRHEHRVLDGQRVPVGEKFEVDGLKIEYPGDPTAEARLIYNCRCTLVPVLKGFEVDSKDLSLRNTNHMEEETYEEWKANHPSYSDPITKQDEIEETMKRAYGAEYKYYKLLSDIYNKTKGFGLSFNGIVDKIKSLGIIRNREVRRLIKPLSTREIIDKIGRPDKTGGSCSSVALAYIGNKAGYDVTDFKGGLSRIIFSNSMIVSKIASFPGVISEKVSNTNDFISAKQLLSNVKEGKEYYFAVGKHAAIVKIIKGEMRYLELQSKNNRFKKLTQKALKNRFGCVDKRTVFNQEVEADNYLIDVDSLCKSDDFIKILKYINK